MKVYIAGPINGYLNSNIAAFALAEAKLIDMGHFPINPHYIPPLPSPHVCRGEPAQHGHRYGCYMIPDLKELLGCDGYTLLDGWEQSRGARIEEAVAVICGLQFVELP